MTRSRDIADSQDNLGGAVSPVTAGKNAIINGGFDFWQRGTSFASPASGYIYTADRWLFVSGSFVTGRTLSRQASGLTGIQYCGRLQRDSGNTSTQPLYLHQTLETAESLRFAGQTITFSFYARVGANYSGSNSMNLIIASGTGTDQQVTNFTGNVNICNISFTTLSTTWQRFTATVAVPSNSTELGFYFSYTPSGTAGAADYLETTGFQLELGGIATPFSRAGGTIQGELAACQRYYYRQTAGSAYGWMAYGGCQNTTNGQAGLVLPVQMRVVPTALEYANVRITDASYSGTLTSLALQTGESTPNLADIYVVATGITGGRPLYIGANNNAAAYLAVTAEL